MIHNISVKIVNFLSKYGSIKKSREVYIYGTECFINEMIEAVKNLVSMDFRLS